MKRAWLLVWLALAGCTRHDRPLIDRVSVSEFEGEEVLGETQSQVVEQLRKLAAASRFDVIAEDTAPKDAKPWRVTATLAAQEPKLDDAAQGRVAVLLSFRQRGGEPFEVSTRARVKSTSNLVDDIQAASRAARDEAVSAAFDEARSRLELVSATPAVLEQKLAKGSAPERRAALRLLVAAKNPAALPVLLEMLKDHEQLRRAMGMLVELGEPSASKAIIDATTGGDETLQREVVFALGALGGADAEAFLFVVAQGHEDPHMQAWATQALEELKQRAAKGAERKTK